MMQASVRTVLAFLSGVIGSRAALAVFALLFVAFTAQAVHAPDRLPPIQGPANLAQLGLAPLTPPPPPEFELAASIRAQVTPELLAEAQSIATETVKPRARSWLEDVLGRLREAMSADPMLGRWVNTAGAVASFAMMFLALALYAQRLPRAGAPAP